VKNLPPNIEVLPATALKPPIVDEGFPRVYAVIKWSIVISLIFLAVAAAAFWILVLGDFAGSGFRPVKPYGQGNDSVVITPECAWPYGVNDHDAKAICSMFNHLTPEQREEVLKTRKKKADLSQPREKQ
jgi:hypothetical protein